MVSLSFGKLMYAGMVDQIRRPLAKREPERFGK